MATEFTQDAVLKFLCSKNGRVKNSELIAHFKQFIRDDENRAQNRELFKRFVNSLAVVKQEEGVSFVVLRKKYMGLVRYVGDTPTPKTPCENTANPNPKEAFSKKDSSRIPEKRETITGLKVKGKKPSHVGNGSTLQKNPDKILSAAGFVNCDTETVNIETNTNILPLNTTEHSPPLTTLIGTDNRPCTLKPSELQSNESGETCQQVQTGRVASEAVFPSLQSPDLTGVVQESICSAEQGQSEEPYGQNKSVSSSLECQYNEIKIIVPENVSWNNVRRRLSDESLQSSLESVSATQPLHNLLATNPRISSSTPCLLDCSESANNLSDYRLVAHSNGSLPRLNDRLRSHSRESSGEEALFGPQSVRHSLSPDNARSHTPDSFAEHHHARLSTSYGDLLLPYNDSAWHQSLPRETWSSDDSLNYAGLPCEQGGKVREMLRRAQEARLFSNLHCSERRVGPLHRSMGNLDDQEPEAARTGSGSTTPIPVRPSARRTRSQLRSRMCRSLGTDIDQPFFEDGVSARLNRLHLLSSSLSISYSTPSRTPSYGDVSSQGSGSGCGRIQPVSDGSIVPLDPKEHDWMVKAAAGTWPDIYSLFREEPSLLAKRDFISGYTVLHWIAKHGDHRVLNTLWYGVSKMGMKLDVDAKTTCGYTPLHLAAIHGHKKLIRLLVHKFKANAAMRDTSGKKPWQYIGKGGPRDLLQLLGAPLCMSGGYGVSKHPRSAEKLMPHPVTMSPKVKRHSSIAAFLKPKYLLRVSGHPESFV